MGQQFVSPYSNFDESSIALSPGNLPVKIVQSQTPDVSVYYVPAGAGYNVTNLPMKIAAVDGRQVYVDNGQATPIRVIGSAAGDPGVIVDAGKRAGLSANSAGYIIPMGGNSGTSGNINAITQATWYIDSVNGSDKNDGETSATALQTFAEMVRRWGPNAMLMQSTLVNILSATMLAGDEISIEGLRALETDFTLNIRGSRFAGTALGAITAVSQINHAVQDGALAVTIGAITWPAQNTRVRINGGARDGAVAMVAIANTAAGQSKLSPFTSVTPGIANPITSYVQPQVGDNVIIETISTFSRPFQLNGNNVQIVFDNIQFLDDAAVTFSIVNNDAGDEIVALNQCIVQDGLEVFGQSTVYFNGGSIGFMAANSLSQTAVLAALVVGFFNSGFTGNVSVDIDTICVAAKYSQAAGAGFVGDLLLGSVAVYNLPLNSAFVTFFADGVARQRTIFGADGVVYGTSTSNAYFFLGRDNAKLFLQDPANIIAQFGAGFALIATTAIPATQKLYPLDNHGNQISMLGYGSTPLQLDTYPVSQTHVARGVVLTNVASLASFTVAGNDGITYVQNDIVVLLAQTTPSQNGPWVVGVVAGGTAALVRPDWFYTGTKIPRGMVIQTMSDGSLFNGPQLKAFCSSGKIVDTDDPIFIPDFISQTATLVNGTVNITNVPLKPGATLANGKISVSVNRTTPSGTANTVQYNPTAMTVGELGSGAPSITVQAQVAAGTINAADQSTLSVGIEQW